MAIFVDFPISGALAYSKDRLKQTIDRAGGAGGGSHVAPGVLVNGALQADTAIDFLNNYSKENLADFSQALRDDNYQAAAVRRSKNGYSIVPITFTLTKDDLTKIFNIDNETIDEAHKNNEDINLSEDKVRELGEHISRELKVKHSSKNDKEMNLPVFTQSKIHFDGKNIHLHAYISLHAVEEHDISAALDTQKNEVRQEFIKNVEKGIGNFTQKFGVTLVSSQQFNSQDNAMNDKLSQVIDLKTENVANNNFDINEVLSKRQIIEQSYNSAKKDAEEAQKKFLQEKSKESLMREALNTIDQFEKIDESNKALKNEVHELNSALFEKDETIKTLDDANNDLEVEKEEVETENETLKTDLSSTKEVLETVKSELNQAIAEKTETEIELKEAYAVNDELSDANNVLVENNNSLKSEIETKNEIVDSLKSEIETKNEIVTGLNSEVSDLREQITSLTAEISSYKDANLENMQAMQEQQQQFMLQMQQMQQQFMQQQQQQQQEKEKAEEKKRSIKEEVTDIVKDKVKEEVKEEVKDKVKEKVKDINMSCTDENANKNILLSPNPREVFYSKKGDDTKKLAGKVKDFGDSLKVEKIENVKMTAKYLVKVAQKKGWESISLNGTDEFIKACSKEALKNNITINTDDEKQLKIIDDLKKELKLEETHEAKSDVKFKAKAKKEISGVGTTKFGSLVKNSKKINLDNLVKTKEEEKEVEFNDDLPFGGKNLSSSDDELDN